MMRQFMQPVEELLQESAYKRCRRMHEACGGDALARMRAHEFAGPFEA